MNDIFFLKKQIISFFSDNKLYFLISSFFLVIILDSNFSLALIKPSLIDSSFKIFLFALYISIFIVSVFLILVYTKKYINIKNTQIEISKFYYFSIAFLYSFLSIVLIFTIIQMIYFNSYDRISFYLVSYASFLSVIIFSSILAIRFLKWFLHTKNYLILGFVFVFVTFIFSILVGLTYLNLRFITYSDSIEPDLPINYKRTLYNVQPSLEITLKQIYYNLFVLSSIFACILTIFILKQYSNSIGMFKFWILVSLPVIFFILDFQTIHDFLDKTFNIPISTKIHQTIESAILAALVNSQTQIVGIFFALSFLTIALKLKNNILKNNLMISVVGLMLLFSSRDFEMISYAVFPPGGLVTISFMSIGSFLLVVGFISFVRYASMDRKLYEDLTKKIETDQLIKKIIFSEREIETINTVKPLMDFAAKWKKENEYLEIKVEDINNIIHSVISDLREKKRINDNDNSETFSN